jgi:hypothetical protein
VPGIYASFSVPMTWSLQQLMSDAAGDVYYSGPSGAAGESVVQANVAPAPGAPLPAVVKAFLGGRYRVVSVVRTRLHNATLSWRYRFSAGDGQTGLGTLAWVKATRSEVWLVALPAAPTTEKVLSTLALAP